MKFNSKSIHINDYNTRNAANAQAYKQSPEQFFASILLTSFVEDKFYLSASNELRTVDGLFDIIDDKKFMAQCAIYARREVGMRSITHYVAAKLAINCKGEPWIKHAIASIICRPDDILEIVACYMHLTKKKSLPASLRKGIGIALRKFDTYQLAKYKGNRGEVRMVDVFNLAHPQPADKDQEIDFKNLMTGNLPSEDTWEAMLSEAGQKGSTENEKSMYKAEAWHNLIIERKIGYLALLRNLRNIVEQSPYSIEDACRILENEHLIRKSKVLPFRYLTALEEMNKIDTADSRRVRSSIAHAFGTALNNMPKLEGRNLIAVDASGSMMGKPIEIACMFAAALYKSTNADVLMFDDQSGFVNPGLLNDNLYTLFYSLKKQVAGRGRGTDFNCIFAPLIKPYDRIIILSDMQAWVDNENLWRVYDSYKRLYKCDPFIYSFDLQGYGSMMFNSDKVFSITGFSEKVFDIIPHLEQNRNALIDKIKSVVI